MPELPEVETIKSGLLAHTKNHIINHTIVRQPQLRWPIPSNLPKLLKNKTIKDIQRRAKYLLFLIEDEGILVIHLGMSGNLQIVEAQSKLKKHDHVDIILDNSKILRYHDPRRFGAIFWINNNNNNLVDCLSGHQRFSHLGPEPLTAKFNTSYIYTKAQSRNTAVKSFIMNNSIVVGVGNIYATEALFYSKINPTLPVGQLSKLQWAVLIKEIKRVLTKAIKAGGTTLKDFTKSDGKPGYFKQKLAVYGRAGEPCQRCQAELVSIKQQGRATVYCPCCQSSD